MAYLVLDSLALLVFAYSVFLLWVLIISDEGSLPEIRLSYASKLASIDVVILVNRSVNVLYTGKFSVLGIPINLEIYFGFNLVRLCTTLYD